MKKNSLFCLIILVWLFAGCSLPPQFQLPVSPGQPQITASPVPTLAPTPTVENYGVWNISLDRLEITFNEYQVAAYYAGPQTVTIPLAAIQKNLIPDAGLVKQ